MKKLLICLSWIAGTFVLFLVAALLGEPPLRPLRGYIEEPRCEFTFVSRFHPDRAVLVVYQVTPTAPKNYLPVQVFAGELTMTERYGLDGPQMRQLTNEEKRLTRDCLEAVDRATWEIDLSDADRRILKQVITIVLLDGM